MSVVAFLNDRHTRRISLLLMLRTLNKRGVYPTRDELIIEDDGRPKILIGAMGGRRSAVSAMVNAGLIGGYAKEGEDSIRLAITKLGLINLQQLGIADF